MSEQVYGYSEDMRYAMVIRGEAAYVGRIVNGEPCGLRWECSVAHLGYYPEVYRNRFPLYSAFGIAKPAPIITEQV